MGGAAVTTTAGFHQFSHRQKQGLLSAHLPLCHRFHPPELLLGQIETPIVFHGVRAPAGRLHGPSEAGAIPRGKQHQAKRRLAIPSRSAGLLQIPLRRGRQVEMQNETHISPVHTHAKGNRGNQDWSFMLQEQRQRLATRLRLKTGVVRSRRHVQLPQTLCPALHRAPCPCVDQRCPTPLVQGFENQRHGIPRAASHGVLQVVAAG